jgi:hypothetical protein
MSITERQKNTIIDAVKSADPDAKIWLFGFRADDSKKGGDIDIAILSEIINRDVMREIQVRRFICDRIRRAENRYYYNKQRERSHFLSCSCGRGTVTVNQIHNLKRNFYPCKIMLMNTKI